MDRRALGTSLEAILRDDEISEITQNFLMGRNVGLKLLTHKTVRFLLAVSLVLGAYVVYGRITAPMRIAPVLQTDLARGGTVDIAVRLPFKPEQFHINLFQQVGTVQGVQGNVVLIRRVRTADVERLARYYWIQKIDPISAAAQQP